MNGIQRILHVLHKLSGGLLFRDYSISEQKNAAQDTKLSTWKVDWIDGQGNKGTYETNETDLEEAEWKFKICMMIT
jgi:hypothetical protein